MWSDAQWSARSPLVVAADGGWRNCCSSCSDNGGHYHSVLGPTATAHTPWTSEDLRTTARTASTWLKYYIPHRFWTHFIDLVQSLNEQHRESIAAYNVRHGLKAKKSLMKLMSYWGAVRAWKDARLTDPSWVDVDGTVYWDCSNFIYAEVMLRTWPSLRDLYYNDGSIGDVLEAFLGYAWRCRRRDLPQSSFQQRFVEQVELLSFAVWALQHFYHSTTW